MARINRRNALLTLLASGACTILPLRNLAQAQTTDLPPLTVRKDGDVVSELTQSDLAALPQHTILTKTPWHDQPTRFTGPSIDDILGADVDPSTDLFLTAVNDYVATGTVAFFRENGAILAIKENDAFLTIDNKGPVFIVFPFTDRPELSNQKHYSRCVWQLVEIETA